MISSSSVTFTDATNFVSTVNINVGDLFANIYTFNVPTASSPASAWCAITKNEIFETNGTPYGGTIHDGSKIAQCASGSPTCTSFSLATSFGTNVSPQTVSFKVKSTWTNGLEHVSPQADIIITCSGNSKYEIVEQAAPTNPQYIENSVATNGFELPTYKTMFKTGSTYAYPG